MLQAQDSDSSYMGRGTGRKVARRDRNIYSLGMCHSGLLTTARIQNVVGDGITCTGLIHDELLISWVIGYGESVRILHSDRKIEIYGITLQDRINRLRVLLTSATGGKANKEGEYPYKDGCTEFHTMPNAIARQITSICE